MKRLIHAIVQYCRWLLGVGIVVDNEHVRVAEPTPPSPLVLLPVDLWNSTMSKYFKSSDYVALYTTGDSRMGRILNTMMPDSMDISRLSGHIIVARLLRRARIDVNIGELVMPSSFFGRSDAVISTSARSIRLCKDFEADVNYTGCPNLVSLELINVGLTCTLLNVRQLLKSLPRTLTELTAKDGILLLWKSLQPNQRVSAMASDLYEFLPNLTSLDVSAWPVVVPTEMHVPDNVCRWPSGLTSLSLSVWANHLSLPFDFNYPKDLTFLKISSSVPGGFAQLKCSTLPPLLKTLIASPVSILYDVPLPSSITSLTCHEFLPGYNLYKPLPFLLPSSLTQLWPTPPYGCVYQYPVPIRILTHTLEPNATLEPMTNEDVEEWMSYERAGVGLAQFASAFCRPSSFNFCERTGDGFAISDHMVDAFAKRIGKSVYCLEGVSNRKLVAPLLRHCTWLMQMTLTTPSASDAFLEHASNVQSSRKSERCKMPHLLFRLTMDICASNFVARFRSLAATQRLPIIESVRDLELILDMHQLVRSDLASLVARVFPSLERLRLVESDASSAQYMLDPDDVRPALFKLPRLRYFALVMNADATSLTFAPDVFVESAPRYIRHVELSYGRGGGKSVRSIE